MSKNSHTIRLNVTWDDLYKEWQGTYVEYYLNGATSIDKPLNWFDWLKANYHVPTKIGNNYAGYFASPVSAKRGDFVSCKECHKSVQLTADIFDISKGILCDQCAH